MKELTEFEKNKQLFQVFSWVAFLAASVGLINMICCESCEYIIFPIIIIIGHCFYVHLAIQEYDIEQRDGYNSLSNCPSNGMGVMSRAQKKYYYTNMLSSLTRSKEIKIQ